MVVLIGPCMFLAPLVLVVALLAIPLWPVAIVLIGACWLAVWPLERLVALAGFRGMRGWSAAIARLFVTVLRPWDYFDAPRKDSD
ncbi:MAG: hypothetical protein ACHQQ3_05475 [Gemmatimonadales bacterium]